MAAQRKKLTIPDLAAKKQSGERLVMAMPGGGGYGAPFRREPAAVREDVLDGLVSREAALRDYGVALSESAELDAGATARAREGR